MPIPPIIPPQSNQRGIETSSMVPVPVMMTPGLNRTSVGLKPEDPAPPLTPPPGLNRTSVGLKLSRGAFPLATRLRLNRTSVGLKRHQKGSVCRIKHPASIEPAWD